MSKQYNIFISHSWSYDENYQNLINKLKSDPNFSFKDYSVPKNDPIHNATSTSALRDAIKTQIAPCSVVLMLAGVYSTFSKWINEEINICKNSFLVPKKIIAIEPWASEKTSTVVKNNADRIVKWNTSSIINTIKEIG